MGANAFTVNSAGAITATTGITTSGAYTQSGVGINAFTGNVGVGTTTPQTLFSVVGGNVGIGTSTSANSLSLVGGVAIGSATYANTAAPSNGIIVSGNVGIGSQIPGKALDVTGTIRTTYFTMSGQAPISGYVLTASDSAGDTTWSSPGGVSGWTVSGNNVYETGGGNVGIGTTFLTTAALTVMNGNVGIGTWVPALLLDIKGTLRTTNFTMSNGNPTNGYILTASDSAGDSTWSSVGAISGWTLRAIMSTKPPVVTSESAPPS